MIAKMCNLKCDAHSTPYVEDVSQSDTAADEMCGLGLYSLSLLKIFVNRVIKSICCWTANQSE